MNEVMMYTTGICPFCIRVKQLFDDLGVSYREIRVDQDAATRLEMTQASGRRTVPQIFIGDRHIGGYDDALSALRSGQLKIWLKEAGIYV